jgi:hypothetical protein
MSDDSLEWDEATEKAFGLKELDEMSDLSEHDDDDDDDDDDDTPLDKLSGIQSKKNKR